MLFKKQNIKSLQDIQLINKFYKTKNTIYFNELFERYYHLVFGVCLKYLKDADNSKDMVLAIFEKILYNNALDNVNNFRNWLYVITKNYCLMKIRADKRRNNYESVFTDLYCEIVSENENEVDNKIDLIKLQTFINSLKHEHKACIELFYFENKSYKEICEITGYNEKEVKSYLQNGKKNLFKLISNNSIYEHI